MTPPLPTARLRFRWSWRPYQARLLEVVDRHLSDHRLHVVAAPGAGKTTLGLEVFRRLGRPALVLAPTLTIRAQWLRRLEDFVDPDEGNAREVLAGWVSSDLSAPAFFTVATYQAVLSHARADAERESPGGVPEGGLEAEEADAAADEPPSDAPTDEDVRTLVGTLRAAGVRTLILDEAHHLKRAWWRALGSVVDGLGDVTLVSLTGTPPYDATGLEWRRYEELCGPIDDEISVPELVKAGTLCPHQDFVLAVSPHAGESARAARHDEAVRGLLAKLVDDSGFQQVVDGHPWLRAEEPDLQAVLDEPELAVALLSYLKTSAAGLPPGLLAALDISSADVPTLDRRWWQVLLAEYLFGDSFEVDPAKRRALATTMRSEGLLWRRSLRIVASPAVERALSLSASKVDGCVAVQRAEREERGDDLRQVVLTDYIRPEGLDGGPGEAGPDLGAFPVFEALRRERGSADDPGDVALLTGSLSIVHESRWADLASSLPDSARPSALTGRPGWVRLGGVPTGRLVAAVTRLFQAGRIRTLVGTRSLLGEGWDAPAVNSLVLASFVGASVGTNQMRGRAIRTDPARPDKVASVWHLVAVAPETPTGFLDLDALRSRFDTFVGLSAWGRRIESGFERLDLPRLRGEADVESFNAESLSRLGRLDEVADGWREAIRVSKTGQVVPTVSFRRPPTLRPLHLARTLKYVLYEAGLASVAAVGETLRRIAVAGGEGGDLGVTVLVVAAIPMALVAPRLLRALRLAIRHAPVAGSVQQIGEAVLAALVDAGLVDRASELRVRAGRTAAGGAFVSLEGGTFYDQSVFADAVGEVLGPVENPRYLITRRGRGLFGARVDYHAVPTVLGTKKALAESFHAAWLRSVGPGELIYTRREGGRRLLLAARARALANQLADPGERRDRWQ